MKVLVDKKRYYGVVIRDIKKEYNYY